MEYPIYLQAYLYQKSAVWIFKRRTTKDCDHAEVDAFKKVTINILI